MLRLGDEHHVAAAQVRLSPRTRNKVECFGGATEHHELGCRYLKKRSDTCARRLVPVSRHLGERVGAAVRVRIGSEQVL